MRVYQSNVLRGGPLLCRLFHRWRYHGFWVERRTCRRCGRSEVNEYGFGWVRRGARANYMAAWKRRKQCALGN
jgi:hypothetical protein